MSLKEELDVRSADSPEPVLTGGSGEVGGLLFGGGQPPRLIGRHVGGPGEQLGGPGMDGGRTQPGPGPLAVQEENVQLLGVFSAFSFTLTQKDLYTLGTRRLNFSVSEKQQQKCFPPLSGFSCYF